MVIFLTATVIQWLLMRDTFFYLGIKATVIHAVFISYLFKIKIDPLCKIICTQYIIPYLRLGNNTVHRDMKLKK